MPETNKNKKTMPAQKQHLPGSERKMQPKPITDDPNYKGSGKLQGKVAFITGGDSGIGKAVAILFAKEGAKVAIIYLSEHRDAKDTQKIIKGYGSEALLIPGDLAKPAFCKTAVDKAIKAFGKIDILVNNAAEQHAAKDLEALDTKNLERTFRVNILAMFYLTKAAIPYMGKGSCIIN